MTTRTHRNLSLILDMLAQQDRTMSQIMYDESDPTQGIEDSDRSEQLHSDMDMWDHIIRDMMQASFDLVITETDYEPDPAPDHVTVTASFHDAPTERITHDQSRVLSH